MLHDILTTAFFRTQLLHVISGFLAVLSEETTPFIYDPIFFINHAVSIRSGSDVPNLKYSNQLSVSITWG